MNNYYFTFGANHLDKYGNSLGDKFVSIPADQPMEAVVIMMQARDMVWATSYTEEQFSGQAEKYGLQSVPLEQVTLTN